jgi:esterase/lipase superfamily enzyme
MMISMKRFARASAFLAVGLVFFALGTAARADDAQQLWLVSTRDAACRGDKNGASPSVRYWRFQDNCQCADSQWADADAKKFHADDAAMPTVIFIHGNGIDADDAVDAGFQAYRTILADVGDRPFRFVIWSWPADRFFRRRLDDVLLKADYSDTESYRLATWLNEMPPGAKISLVGHSFGPRIIVGALQLLAGGEVAGNQLPKNIAAAWASGKRNPIRAVLLAPAIDDAALASCGCDSLALALLDRAAVTVNRRDFALKLYPLLQGRGGPRALGRVGPCGVEDEQEKLAVVDVSCTVGKTHNCQRYCSASNLACLWAKYTFLDAPGEKDSR